MSDNSPDPAAGTSGMEDDTQTDPHGDDANHDADMEVIETMVEQHQPCDVILSHALFSDVTSSGPCQQHLQYSHPTEYACAPLQELVFLAITHRHLPLVRAVLALPGFSPHCHTDSLPAPLNLACYLQLHDLLPPLLAAGCNVHMKCGFRDWQQKVSSFDIVLQNDDVTALEVLYPCYRTHVDRVLRCGAPAYFHRHSRGMRAIHAAIEHNAVRCVTHLLTQHPEDNESPFRLDRMYYQPIDYAVGRSLDMFKLLMAHDVTVPENIATRFISAPGVMTTPRVGGWHNNDDFREACRKLDTMTRYFVEHRFAQCHSEGQFLDQVLDMAATFEPVALKCTEDDVTEISALLLSAVRTLLSRNDTGRVLSSWSLRLVPVLVDTFLRVYSEQQQYRRWSLLRAELYMSLVRVLLRAGADFSEDYLPMALPPLTVGFRVCFLSSDMLTEPSVWRMFRELVRALLLHGVTAGLVHTDGTLHALSRHHLHELRCASEHTLTFTKQFLTWYLNALPCAHYAHAAKTLRRTFLEQGAADLADFLAEYRRVPRTLRRVCRATIIAHVPRMRIACYADQLGLPRPLEEFLLDLDN